MKIEVKMGTPNTICFKCPNCGKLMSTQYPGYGEQLAIEKLCECEITKFEAHIERSGGCRYEVCSECNMVIIFKTKTGFKKVKLLTPVIRKE